jgi:hypothetical protein
VALGGTWRFTLEGEYYYGGGHEWGMEVRCGSWVGTGHVTVVWWEGYGWESGRNMAEAWREGDGCEVASVTV